MYKRLILGLSLLMLSACATDNTISESEMRAQNRTDAVVASLLFEKGLDETATYNVRNDGSVAIHFNKSVPFTVYNNVVQTLRDNPAVKSVYAEQEGAEVCPLR